MNLLRTKSVEQSIHDTDEPEYQLRKSLTWLDLTVFGVGPEAVPYTSAAWS